MNWALLAWLMRPRASIVIGGAVLILALIKLTSLLPERYYFRFSTLVSSEDGAFIVDPPGVTEAKMCEIVRRNQASDPKFAVESWRCPASTNARTRVAYGPAHTDEIYRVVLKNDETLRGVFERIVSSYSPQLVVQDELDKALAQTTDLASASDAVGRLLSKLPDDFGEPELSNTFNSIFGALPVDGPEERGSGSPDAAALSDKGRSAMHAAVDATNVAIKDHQVRIKIAAMTKKQLDNIVASAYSRDDVARGVANYYLSQVSDAYLVQLRNSLKAQGVDPERDKSAVDFQLRLAGLQNYVVSVAVRLAPVLMFGFLAGMLFGVKEIGSIALAGAVAAFLLVWPVITLWDRVVSYGWQDKRPIFIGLYVIYVVSFFFVAKFAAGGGAMLHRYLPGSAKTASSDAGANDGVLVVSVVRDLLVGLIVSMLFYVGNALAPLA